MSIVVITIPGERKKDFYKLLNKETGGAVRLVVIQKTKKESIIKRLRRLYSVVGGKGMFRELFYTLKLRSDRKILKKLDYFRLDTKVDTDSLMEPRTVEVDDVNSKEVENMIRKVSPKLLVVWGSALLKKNILSNASKAINLHMGYCPFYRGAVANQYALLSGDISHIGATIHYISDKADAGDTIEIIPCDPTKGPRELFTELNDKAFTRFIYIAKSLHQGENLPSHAQNLRIGKMMYLKEWIPSLRYKAGTLMEMWEKGSEEDLGL